MKKYLAPLIAASVLAASGCPQLDRMVKGPQKTTFTINSPDESIEECISYYEGNIATAWPLENGSLSCYDKMKESELYNLYSARMNTRDFERALIRFKKGWKPKSVKTPLTPNLGASRLVEWYRDCELFKREYSEHLDICEKMTKSKINWLIEEGKHPKYQKVYPSVKETSLEWIAKQRKAIKHYQCIKIRKKR